MVLEWMLIVSVFGCWIIIGCMSYSRYKAERTWQRERQRLEADISELASAKQAGGREARSPPEWSSPRRAERPEKERVLH